MLALLVNTFLHKRVHDFAAQALLSCREHFPDTSGILGAADWRILLFRRRRKQVRKQSERGRRRKGDGDLNARSLRARLRTGGSFYRRFQQLDD